MENTKNVVAFEEFLQGVIEESPRKEISSSQVAYDILLGVLGMNADQVAGGFYNSAKLGNSAQALFEKEKERYSKDSFEYTMRATREIAQVVSRNIAIIACPSKVRWGTVYRVCFVNDKQELQDLIRVTDSMKLARLYALAVEAELRQPNRTKADITERVTDRFQVLLNVLGYTTNYVRV